MKSLFPDEVRKRLHRTAVVAVLVLDDAAAAVPVATALLEGGIDMMELTLRTPAALECLRQVRRYVPEMLAGVGTVLKPEQIDLILDAGAAFGVAPGVNPAVISYALHRGLPFAPGVMTPTDIEIAVSHGCRELKYFPAEPAGGLKLLSSIRAPFAHLGVSFIPLGGINTSNMAEYLADPGVLAVGGSWLVQSQTIRDKDWPAITRAAREARRIADEVRQSESTRTT